MKTKKITLASAIAVMVVYGTLACQTAYAQTASAPHASNKSQSKAERKAARKQKHFADQKQYGKNGYR